MDELGIHAATPEYALGWAPGVMLYVWRAETTMEAARTASATLEHAREATPSGRGVLLGLIEARTPPPKADVRREIAEGLVRNGDFVIASAVVFEGQGFQASMVRMVATGLSLIKPLPFPHQVFGDLDEGTQWLREAGARESVRLRAQRLTALMDALRRAPTTPAPERSA